MKGSFPRRVLAPFRCRISPRCSGFIFFTQSSTPTRVGLCQEGQGQLSLPGRGIVPGLGRRSLGSRSLPLGCDPRHRFHSIIGQIFPYQISAQVSTSLARIIRNIQGKPGAFSHLLFARNLVFWDSGWSAGKGSSRMIIHGRSSGICLNSKQIWRENKRPGSLC